jgi:hypothetical protein
VPRIKVDHTTPTVVTAGASPVILTIDPHAAPMTLVITSASAITVTGTAVQSRPVDVDSNR